MNRIKAVGRSVTGAAGLRYTAGDRRLRPQGDRFLVKEGATMSCNWMRAVLCLAAAGLFVLEADLPLAPRPAVTAAEEEKPKDEQGFVPLFNGRDLTGWEGNEKLWKVEDGMLVGDSPGIKQNEFLATKRTFGDFELRLDFRLRKGEGNSGVQFRSKRDPQSSEVEGYQADIGENYWGCLYDEHRRRKVLVQAPEKLKDVLKLDGWNSYVIRAEGDHVTLAINGLTTVDYREPDPKIARDGIIAVQVHSGGPLRVEFKNIRIRELRPAAESK